MFCGFYSLHHYMGWSAVCDCGTSWSYSFTFYQYYCGLLESAFTEGKFNLNYFEIIKCPCTLAYLQIFTNLSHFIKISRTFKCTFAINLYIYISRMDLLTLLIRRINFHFQGCMWGGFSPFNSNSESRFY